MADNYRSINGRKARGVPKRFSEADLARRRELARSIQQKGADAMARRSRLRRERLEERKRLVADMAAQGVFVPVAEFE